MKQSSPQKQGTTLRHWQGAWWWIIPALIGITMLWSILSLAWRPLPPEGLLAGMALILGVAYFLQQQHIEQARFFRELFTDFNHRYDRLNKKLMTAVADKQPFSADAKQRFIDYFNLCAEEWLFYKAGYIYDDVWQAWGNGMRQFARDPRVADLWRTESATESYYGFDLLRETRCEARAEE